MKKSFLLLFTWLLFSNGFAQEKNTRKITVEEWITEMINCPVEEYTLENAEITYDMEVGTMQNSRLIIDNKKPEINCNIKIHNCKFPITSFNIDSIIFNKHVFFVQCNVTNMNIKNCEFKEGIEILWGNLGLLLFMNTVFGDGVDVFEAEISLFKFSKCTFDVKKQKVRSYINLNVPPEDYKCLISIAAPNSLKRVNILNIDSCTINAHDVVPVIYLTLADFNAVSFFDIDFKNTILNFETCSIEKTFEITNCKFSQPIGTLNFNFPDKGTNFCWEQIEDVGIAIYDDDFKSKYTASTESEIKDRYKYDELISSYNNFHTMYRTRGDMKSANSCYIAMKDVETRRLELLYNEHKTLDSFFNWKLNKFLKFFCQYGTSPIRALIISMWVILGFALFYFFFDNDWDKINKGYLLNKYKAVLLYFQSDKKLADYYTEKHHSEIGSYNEFKSYLAACSANIPNYLLWLGKQLYRFSTTRRMLDIYIFSKMEMLENEWIKLNPKRKRIVSVLTITTMVLFVVYLLIYKAINSFFLSINTFSTLGFGSIPVKGLSRYMAIMQGFLGWFLLSIFSVSLINQII